MSVRVIDQDVLIKCNESVGKIHSLTTNYCGTGFRVGPNYIMTALHVLEGIMSRGYCFCYLAHLSLMIKMRYCDKPLSCTGAYCSL